MAGVGKSAGKPSGKSTNTKRGSVKTANAHAATAPNINANPISTAMDRRLAVIALFVVSASGLIFEITLTRLFSLFFQYHFTFLAVSLAVLGLSAGAASAHYVPVGVVRSARLPVFILIALSLALSAATVIIAWLPSADSIFPRAMIALIIFFVIGLFDAITFVKFATYSSSLYAADLIGAAVGVMAVLWLLSLWSAFSMTLFLAALIGVLGVLLAYRTAELGHPRILLLRLAVGSLAIGALLLVVNLFTGVIDFNPAQLSGATRDKTMYTILQDPTQNARILYTGWSPFARVDVVQTKDASARYIFADGGAGAYMMYYDNNPQTVANLQQSVEFLPYSAITPNKTLIIGAGGGKDVLMAMQAKSPDVTAVEVNPAVVAATRYFEAYNGHILDLPQVHLVEGDARSFVERTTDHYDVIYLNLVYTQAVEPASQALVENYIFTRQAFKTYLDRLNPGGRLAIISHNEIEGSRAAVTALQALQDMGTPPIKALDNIWLWSTPASDVTISTTVLIVSKDALPSATIQTLNAAAQGQGMQPLFVPGSAETMFAPIRNGQSIAAFTGPGNTYNIAPTDDDQPYFFNLDFGLPPAIRTSLIMAIVLALGLIIVTILARTADDSRQMGRRLQGWLFIGYAALIGIGFMLVEVPLIQRFQLLLGQPILSLAVVLATLLLAGGIGSAVSQRWLPDALPSRVALAGLWIAVVALIYWVALPGWLTSLLATSFMVRILATIGFAALLGLPMGLPFPSLMRLAAVDQPNVALLWAINGAFSVLGSTLALVISMQWGFRWALLGGAAVYLLVAGVALLLRGYQRAPKTEAVVSAVVTGRT